MKNRLAIKRKSGQVLILVLLVVVVALAVGLSAAARNLTNLKSSTQSENSQRAFAAAEGGVEYALNKLKTVGPYTGSVPVGTTTSNINANVTTTSSTTYVKTLDAAQGDVGQVNLLGANPGVAPSNITVEWGDVTDSNQSPANPTGCSSISATSTQCPSLEITVICSAGSQTVGTVCTTTDNSSIGTTYTKSDGTTAKSNYYRTSVLYSSSTALSVRGDQSTHCGVANSTVDFSGPPYTGYLCKVTVNLRGATDLQFPQALYMRIRPLYGRATVKVSGVTLPAQTYTIKSTAQTSLGLTRAVQVTRDAALALPAFFDHAIWSDTGLNK